MKERLQHLLSEVGESFDYLRSDVRNLSRYMAELEELIEGYRAFVANATLSTPGDQVTMRKLLKRTHKVLGPPPDKPPAPRDPDDQETERAAPDPGTRAEPLVSS
jgi:hypothetical protein